MAHLDFEIYPRIGGISQGAFLLLGAKGLLPRESLSAHLLGLLASEPEGTQGGTFIVLQ